jgi:hypothetical protein
LYAYEQFWDVVTFDLPNNVVTGTVRLLHQIASKDYIEFLRDNNPTGAGNNGDILYELWQTNEKSRPEMMVEAHFGAGASSAIYLPFITKN